jgi:hypothetical protein
MPLIEPSTRGKQLVNLRTRLDRENNETLYAYTHFFGESPECVLNELIDTVLLRRKEFVPWRMADRTSFVPGSKSRPHRSAGSIRRTQQSATPPDSR